MKWIWIPVVAALAPVIALAAEKPLAEGGYAFRSDLSLGGADAADDAFFYEKYGSVEVGANGDGDIYVLDNGNVRVQVFGPDGSVKKSLGSEGDGPGEFRIPSHLAVNARGDFAVFDMSQARISVFDPEGTLKYDQLSGSEIDDLALGDDGTLYVGYGKYGPALVEAYGPDGKVRWKAGDPSPSPGRVIQVEIGVQTIAPRVALLPGDAVVRLPKGDYEVQSFASGGTERGTWSRPFSRRELTEEDFGGGPDENGEEPQKQVIMIRREHGAEGGSGGEDMGEVQTFTDDDGSEAMHFDTSALKQYMPTHHSATRGVIAFPDGRVWVMTSELEKGGNVVDEWSADGRWTRRFTMSSDYDWICLGRDGRLYSVTHDEDDYPTVHRLVVEAGA